jgi:glycosyltransferase involved in cell wall biosynthesis
VTQALKEIIEGNVNGLLFPTGDPLALSQKIKFLINHPFVARKLTQKAYLDWKTKYSIEVFGQTHLNYYNEVIKTHPSDAPHAHPLSSL